MRTFAKILAIADKASLVMFMLSFAVVEYIRDAVVPAIIIVLVSIIFLLCFLKEYKNKPIGNKVIDIFAIIVCLFGFADSEIPSIIGVATMVAALIDLMYFLHLDFYNSKRQSKSKVKRNRKTE